MPIFADDAPVAFSGTRLDWRELPRPVRRRISELAGAQVTAESSATSGFSPGYAAVLEFSDGSEAFVKAVSSQQNPQSPEMARAEIQANQALPSAVKAPKLLWSHDDGDWVVTGFEVIHGYSPHTPWDPAELTRALNALTELSEIVVDSDSSLQQRNAAPRSSGWQTLAQLPGPALAAAAATWGPAGEWAVNNLEVLQEWEAERFTALAGDRLLHGDLRADNIMFDHDKTWLVDWVWAGVGAPWVDLAFMIPSITLQGGGKAQEIFWDQPQAADADPALVRAAVATITAFFLSNSVQAAPLGIPNLRTFQLVQGVEALSWLKELASL